MSNQILLFKFEQDGHFERVRTISIDGEIHFVAADITSALGYANASKAIADHCKEKGITKRYPLSTKGGIQHVTLINEPNLYRLIAKSNLPAAEEFEEWIFEKVIPTIRKKGSYGIDRVETPNFIIRYMQNATKIPTGHFSVLTELFVRLYARFEHAGYVIPNKGFMGKEIRPDVSVGRCFSGYLKDNYPSAPEVFDTYPHEFPSGKVVDARVYPNELLPAFIKYVDEVWIPNNAEQYFIDRDRKALDYLPKLLPNSAA
ncbi:MAG: BRO-N domain-containing protein [Pseudobacter sp.]|uniref:BRO-N domain-containing protein n=1 Tax=Pseudobacter sp. TaxID=2045420 RepID=UPI003F814F45